MPSNSEKKQYALQTADWTNCEYSVLFYLFLNNYNIPVSILTYTYSDAWLLSYNLYAVPFFFFIGSIIKILQKKIILAANI